MSVKVEALSAARTMPSWTLMRIPMLIGLEPTYTEMLQQAP